MSVESYFPRLSCCLPVFISEVYSSRSNCKCRAAAELDTKQDEMGVEYRFSSCACQNGPWFFLMATQTSAALLLCCKHSEFSGNAIEVSFLSVLWSTNTGFSSRMCGWLTGLLTFLQLLMTMGKISTMTQTHSKVLLVRSGAEKIRLRYCHSTPVFRSFTPAFCWVL